jgi:hypothetical protein
LPEHPPIVIATDAACYAGRSELNNRLARFMTANGAWPTYKNRPSVSSFWGQSRN